MPELRLALAAFLMAATLSACATTRTPPLADDAPSDREGAATEATMTSIPEQWAASRTGAEAWIRVWKPDAAAPADNAARGIVVAWHSFRDNAAAWEELAAQWTARGWWVVAPDVAGHGHHPGPFGKLPAGVAAVVEEARGVVEAARAHWRQTQDAKATAIPRRDNDPPTILIGESMGGSIALLVAARHGEALNVRGVATAGAGLRGGIRARWAWDPAIRLSAWLLPGLRFSVDPDYSTTLSPAAARRFAEDPHVIRDVRLDTYSRVVWLAQAATEEVAAVTVPAIYFWGGEDGTILRSSICSAAQAHTDPRRALVIDRADWPHLVFQAPDHEAIGEQVGAFLADPEAFTARQADRWAAPVACADTTTKTTSGQS